MFKAHLAKVVREHIIPRGHGGGGGGDGRPAEGFDMAKTGNTRIGLADFHLWGSQHLAEIYSDVVACDFTTLTTVPGVIKYKGTKTELLDLLVICEGAKDGKGRGCQVIALTQTCDLILMVLKPLRHKKIIQNELEGFGTRLNSKPLILAVRRRIREALISWPLVLRVSWILKLKSIVAEDKIHIADVTLRIDVISCDFSDECGGRKRFISPVSVC